MKTPVLVAAALLSGAPMVQAQISHSNDNEPSERPRRMVPRSRAFHAEPTWYEACVGYDASSLYLTKACNDWADSETNQCPEGTVKILTAEPLANCIQPMIL